MSGEAPIPAERGDAGGAVVLLLGLRGSGKSTVAPIVARGLGVDWTDLDERVLAAFNARDVTSVWRSAGEAAFRSAESRCLAAALDGGAGVVALGGGTPTAPGAAELIRRAQMAGRAVAVYLHAGPAALAARLGRQTGPGGAPDSDADRPALTGGGSYLDEIPAVYARRDPLYRALAACIVDASAPPQAVADAVIGAVRGSTCGA